MDILETLSGQPLVLAIVISLGISCIIAVAGVIPSTFVTAANILYFGFAGGLAISIIGEALGAIISFILYRKGIRKLEEKINGKNHWRLLQRLKDTKGVEAFILVLALRVFPFAPSGLVTLAAAMSEMGLLSFTLSSTIGKIPALLIEAYSVETVLGWKGEYQAGAVIFALAAGVWYYWTTKRKKRRI